MAFDWFYEPNVLITLPLFVGGFIVVSCAIVLALRPMIGRLVDDPKDWDRALAHVISTFGVFFGILLALVAVSVYENFAYTRDTTIEEAAQVGALYRATAGVDPSERDHVRPGQTARLTRLSGGPAIAARVLRIDGQLDPATHLIDVDLGFPAGGLLPGEAVKAEIASGTSAGWTVPHAAVVTDDDGAHVFQIAGGHAKAVPVAIVQASATRDVVQGALDPTRPLIVEGAYQVEDGGAVRMDR